MKKHHDYILMTGAPGSKWSSVVKNIYWSADINHTDYTDERTYWHDADTPGTPQLMHTGAYWDPGMEFEPDNWDGPFENNGKTKIVKSHVFAHDLEFLKEYGYPIILVYRWDVDCLDWWIKCGEFNITYPLYDEYYKDLTQMQKEIKRQNADITKFITENIDKVRRVRNNHQLCANLDIELPPEDMYKFHDYDKKGVKVYVYKK